MPELAEVENIKLSAQNLILGTKITDLETFTDKLRYPIPDHIFDQSVGNCITKLERRGKYLIINMNNNMSLIMHFGMSGRLKISNNFELQKHDHVLITLNENLFMVLHDPREFGLIDVIPTEHIKTHKYFSHLGPEPLDEEFDTEYFIKISEGSNRSIKDFIMDAQNFVGVGNIYASESLFEAGIHPIRTAGSLSIAEMDSLVKCIKEVLLRAIAAGGSTLRDFHDAEGKVGEFQKLFKVYDQEGSECMRCSIPIIKIRQNNRSTYLCGTCQK